MTREVDSDRKPAENRLAGGDFALRLELLRSRAELDRVNRLIESADGSIRTSAGGGELSNAVAAAVADSRELSRLKSSYRYRLASLLANAGRSPLRAARLILRRAKYSVRRLGNKEAQERAGAIGFVVESLGLGQGDLKIHPLEKADSPPLAASELRVAAILDPFSASSFEPECSLELLTPSNWVEQVHRHKPHLLLVESAWTGHSNEWEGLVANAPASLRSLVMSFRHAGIPTVFWNKEDPLHFGAFLETARLFDHVLTTDADCIPRYRRLLGHDRVGVMPFGVQPTIHHPVCSRPRRASSVFAGAWYGRLPERSRDFSRTADALALAGQLVIHDRLNGRGQPHQRFPLRFQPMVRAAVTYQETGEVFRHHIIGVNLNTIKSSPTMFARRAFELAACGTSVYSNHSVGLQLLLAKSVVATDEPERLLREAWAELRDPDAKRYRMRRLQALRIVLGEHTWAHRLQLICEVALEIQLPPSPTTLYVLARIGNQIELDRVCEAFSRQKLPGAQLVLDVPSGLPTPNDAIPLESLNASDSDWVALFHPDDYYGAHYLSDLAMAAKWDLGDFIGKGAWHELRGGRVTERNPGSEYRFVKSLALRRMMLRYGAAPNSLEALLDQLDSGEIAEEGCISIDSWEYLQDGAGSNLASAVSVSCAPAVGMQDITRAGAALTAQEDPQRAGSGALDGAAFADLLIRGKAAERVSVVPKKGRMELCSILNDGERAEWTSAPVPRHQLEDNGAARVCLQAVRSTSTSFRVEAIGARGAVLESLPLAPQVPVAFAPRAGVQHYRFVFDVQGPVVQEIDGVWLGAAPTQPLFAPGCGRLALICNAYPDYRNLYRNAFLHRRVLAYQEHGVGVDVFVVKRGPALRDYEYDGVLVRECLPGALRATLAVSGHAAVAVHFLDPDLWEAVRDLDARTPLVVWLHGADVQAWQHRAVNYRTGQELEAAKKASGQRAAFWKSVLSESGRNMRYVFVSNYLAEQTWDDLGIRPPDDSWSVIHNPIDSSLFRYKAKPPQMAKKVLSIRPHASRIYANDLVAATIHRLAEEEVFPELSFTLVGDGELWEEDFGGLECYPNVTLVRGFLPQSAIAALHREHGVFLVPTRGDTQGVSRDEAMSSGLVPVTNRVGAIPEFVDPSCAELCPPEDVGALTSAVLRLASDPERFNSMSVRASAHVERKSGLRKVLGQELAILGLLDAVHYMCCPGNRHQDDQVPVS